MFWVFFFENVLFLVLKLFLFFSILFVFVPDGASLLLDSAWTASGNKNEGCDTSVTFYLK